MERGKKDGSQSRPVLLRPFDKFRTGFAQDERGGRGTSPFR